MAARTIGTIPQALFSFGEPTYFVLHALASNTANIQYSMTDPTVATDYDELLPGQSVEFTVEPGDIIYIVAASGTQSYTVPVMKPLVPPTEARRGP